MPLELVVALLLASEFRIPPTENTLHEVFHIHIQHYSRNIMLNIREAEG
jgi:hypothetical protein